MISRLFLLLFIIACFVLHEANEANKAMMIGEVLFLSATGIGYIWSGYKSE